MFQVRQPAFVLLLLLVGAATLVTASNSATCSHRVSACNSSVDYFPVKLQFAHSGSVKSLQYYNTYVVAQMSWVAWSGTHAVTYVFVRCGCPSPNVGGDSKEFYVPVSSVLIEETVAVPKLYMIGQGQKVVAVASSAFVTTTQLLDDVRAGLVVDIQSNFTRLLTALPALPDVLLTGTGSTSLKRGWTAEMTARQFLDADAGETSPLGRAELVKLTGLLTGAEDAANAVFGLIAYRYDQMKLIGQAAQRRPTVMLGVPFGSFFGVNGWAITKGSSYMGGFLRDAGMLYLNDDNRLDSLGRVDAATMLGLFGSADLWINALYAQPAGVAFTMDALVSGNQTMTPGGDRSVFTQFKAFQCGAVLANSKAIRAPLAGNPFFELGVVRPDLILADLLHYAHPELRPQLIGSDGSAYVPHFYERPAPLTNSAGVPPCPDVAVPDVPPAGSAMFTQLLSVSGPTVFALQPLLPAVARAISDATGVPRGSLGLSIANATARGENPVLRVSVVVPTCKACEGTAANCDFSMARRLQSVAAVAEATLAQNGTAAIVRQGEPLMLQCHQANLRVPVEQLDGWKPAAAGMSTGEKAGIAVGSCVGGVLVVCAIAALAFRKGRQRGYETLLSERERAPKELTTVHSSAPVVHSSAPA